MKRASRSGAFVGVLLLVGLSVLAAPKSYIKNVRLVMGENESRQKVREAAMLEAKRQVLEEAGVLVTAETTLKDYSKSTGGKLEESSEYRNQVQALAVGVTRTEVTSEVWKDEGGTFVLSLGCRVTVAPEEINAKLRKLADERQQSAASLKPLQDEMARLKTELEGLRQQGVGSADLAVKDVVLPSGEHAVKSELPRDEALTQGWALYERGLYEEATALLRGYLKDHADSPEGHLLMGQVYAQKKGWYNLAVRELARAQELAPTSVQVKLSLATIHMRVGKKPEESIPLLEAALALQPGNATARNLLAEAQQSRESNTRKFQ